MSDTLLIDLRRVKSSLFRYFTHDVFKTSWAEWIVGERLSINVVDVVWVVIDGSFTIHDPSIDRLKELLFSMVVSQLQLMFEVMHTMMFSTTVPVPSNELLEGMLNNLRFVCETTVDRVPRFYPTSFQEARTAYVQYGSAAIRIQHAWRLCNECPSYAVCQRRLRREWSAMNDEIVHLKNR